MLGFKLPMKVPIRAFWVHLQTRSLSRSNLRWYSRKEPYCLMHERSSSKFSQSEDLKWAHNSSSKSAHVSVWPSSRNVIWIHCHHWLALPSKWYDANGTFCASEVFWNSKNCWTQLNHSVWSSSANLENLSLAVFEETIWWLFEVLSRWGERPVDSQLVNRMLERRFRVSSKCWNLSAMLTSKQWRSSCIALSPASRSLILSLLVPMYGFDANGRSQFRKIAAK